MVCAITGASGYVGSVIAKVLREEFKVVSLLRKHAEDAIPWSLDSNSDIAEDLRKFRVDTLIHTAWDFSHPDAKQNDRVNVEGSARLFESAKRAGVKRIIFISTISAFPEARSNYGRSKIHVERMVLENFSGVAIRPGLVWGSNSGGMFGSIRQQIEHSKLVPIIGSGRYPQYMVHEDDLAKAVVRAARGDWHCDQPVTVAHSDRWLLRDLIQGIAEDKKRPVTLLPIPWKVVYLGLKSAEFCGVNLGFRSDSVLSLVYQNPTPDFTLADRLGLPRRVFSIDKL